MAVKKVFLHITVGGDQHFYTLSAGIVFLRYSENTFRNQYNHNLLVSLRQPTFFKYIERINQMQQLIVKIKFMIPPEMSRQQYT